MKMFVCYFSKQSKFLKSCNLQNFTRSFNFNAYGRWLSEVKKRHSIHSLICSNIRRRWLVLFVVVSCLGHTRLSTCSRLQVAMLSGQPKSSNWSAASCSFLDSGKKFQKLSPCLLSFFFFVLSLKCSWIFCGPYILYLYPTYICKKTTRVYTWQFGSRLFFKDFFKCFYTDT